MDEITIPTTEVEEDTRVACAQCGRGVDEAEAEEFAEDTYHATCLRQCTTTCDRCDELVHNEDTREVGGNTWCESCTDNHAVSCVECGEFLDEYCSYTHDGEEYCEYHYDRVREEERESGYINIPGREYATSDLPAFMNGQAGEIITSTRIFSAELECNAPSNSAMQEVADELPRPFGIAHDGSLGDSGVEFQTPKLQGKAGEDAIKTITRILNAHDFTVDRSAGLHIHLDGKGLLPRTRTKTDPRELKDALTFYLAFEEVLLSFLPPSRRGNRFCDKLGKSYHVKEIRDCYTLEKLEQIWYRVNLRRQLVACKERKYHESRYNGVNLHSLLADGHLEIRYHSGTLNPTKILEWTNLHQTILDRACNRLLSTEVAMRGMNTTDLREKTVLMYDALDLPPRARAYFDMRQATFTRNAEDKTEAANLDEVCAA